MLKPKNIAVPAVIGFFLSFLISLIATHKFGSSCLRGLIFGACFGVLSVGIQFLYGRFLSDESDLSLSTGSEGRKSDKPGSIIDITINDENLTDEGENPQFFVASNRHKLGEEDMADSAGKKNVSSGQKMPEKQKTDSVKTEAPVQNEIPSEKNEGFKPVQLGQTVSQPQASPVNEKPSSSVQAAPAVQSVRIAEDEEIDSLPDFSSLEDDGKSYSDNDVIKDSDFAAGRNSTADAARGNSPMNSNAATLAQAIQTLLKRDE